MPLIWIKQFCAGRSGAFCSTENHAPVQTLGNAMSAAGSQIAHELEVFQATLRRVPQEAITAEIIELGNGAETARDMR